MIDRKSSKIVWTQANHVPVLAIPLTTMIMINAVHAVDEIIIMKTNVKEYNFHSLMAL